MFRIFIIVTVFSAVLLWYLHEFHTSKFIEVTRNLPYVTPLLTKVHVYFSRGSRNNSDHEDKLFTLDDLRTFNGAIGSRGIYISILGKVFDVGKGNHHYGPGGAYSIFAGKDSTRSFVTGDFTDSSDHVLDFSPSELISLKDWVNFYERQYTYKGKLIGTFYNQIGMKTPYSLELDKKFEEAKKKKDKEKNDELEFPPCNVEWNADLGTKVWCTTKSGGIERSWVGVPRKLYHVGSDSFRCACINLKELDNPSSVQYARRGHLQLYENCEPDKSNCFWKE